MLNSKYKGLNNKEYILGDLIGKGGEGNVYIVNNDNSIVLKLYNEKQDLDKTYKLKHMILLNNKSIQACAAWPIDLIVKNNEVLGFTMKIIKDSFPLHTLFSPMDRKQLFPDKGYNFLVHVSRNIAVAFNLIHSFGLIAGDVNEGNILVDKNGVINFIDCDSFQINNAGHIYFCQVGVPRYTPPEILKLGTFENIIRTKNTDVFSMSILIFQLMFLGKHPFSGVNLSNIEIDEETAIRNNNFFFSLTGKNKNIKPPLNSLTLDELPNYIGFLFHETFEKNEKRPNTKDWVINLDQFLKSLKKCEKSNLHFFSNNSKNCPWCRFKEQNGILFFLDSHTDFTYKLSDINSFIQGYKIDKIIKPHFNLDVTYPDLKPSQIDKKYAIYKYTLLTLKLSIICSALFLSLSLNNSWFLSILSLFFLINKSSWKTKITNELKFKKTNLETVQNQFEIIMKELKDDRELLNVNLCIQQLHRYVTEFRNMPIELQKAIKREEDKLYNDQLDLFLKKFQVRDHAIPSFATAKKNMLISHGIRNASDISKLNSIKIQGFGPANLQILFSWQRQFINRFSYIPNQSLISKDIENVKSNTNRLRLELEVKIKNEFSKIQNAKLNYLSNQNHKQLKFTSIKRKLIQAQLDFDDFKKKTV